MSFTEEYDLDWRDVNNSDTPTDVLLFASLVIRQVDTRHQIKDTRDKYDEMQSMLFHSTYFRQVDLVDHLVKP